MWVVAVLAHVRSYNTCKYTVRLRLPQCLDLTKLARAYTLLSGGVLNLRRLQRMRQLIVILLVRKYKCTNRRYGLFKNFTAQQPIGTEVQVHRYRG